VNANKKILIVEDEAKIAALMRDYLVAEGYAVEILTEGTSALELVRALKPDLLLLDWMLPGKDGSSICREVREFSNVPIIMLTARVEEIYKLLGLELGADDYICKPFSPREVVARVRALLRRSHWRETPIAERALVLDEAAFEAKLDGIKLNLTPVEFRLLATLYAHPGRVYSRAQLQSQCYTDHRIVSDRTVDSHIKNLRRKFEDVRAGSDPIGSIYGVGYKYEWVD
jgi:two-component system, OmpR family, response regulator BaeR